MSESNIVVPQVADLKRYLVRQGWTPVSHPNSRIETFQAADAASVTIPASNEFSNSVQMVREAIGIIADHENTTFQGLLNRRGRWGKDTLLARLYKINGEETSIPLFVAAEAIGSLKDFMGYAAYTQSEPKPYFDKAGGVSG